MTGVRLIGSTELYASQVMEYKQEMQQHGDVLNGCAGLEKVNTFKEWIDFKSRARGWYGDEAINSEVMLLIRNSDNRLLGISDYRHPLTPALFNGGGHIGYSIRPSERGRGYGTELLRQMLNICREFGENKVLVVCDKENIASRKVITNNGGILEKEVLEREESGEISITQRYWINILEV